MTAQTYSSVKVKSNEAEKVRVAVKTGPAAAAIISGGLGILAIGTATTLSEVIESIHNALNLYKPVGPLSGKTIVGLAIWLISWFILNLVWGDRDVDLSKSATITFILITAGLMLTFPLFWGLFVH